MDYKTHYNLIFKDRAPDILRSLSVSLKDILLFEIICNKNMKHISDLVIKVREKFIQYYENNSQLIDEEDIERVMKNDFTVKRYIFHQLFDELSAYKMLTESMKWRKDFSVNQLTDNYFPKEFYRSGTVFPYCPDRRNLSTLYIRIKMIRKISEMKIYHKKFLVHNINKIDLEASGQGWALVLDASGAGIANCDLDLLIFLISTLNNNFPAAVQYILLHAMPFALSGVWTVAKRFIPSERLNLIKFTTNNNISEYINSKALPDCMGGTAKRDYRIAPADSPDMIEFGTRVAELPLDRVMQISDSYQQLLR